MSKATVTGLVTSLSISLADSTTASDYYDRIVVEHGVKRTSLTDAAYVAGVADTAAYTLPSDAIRLLGTCYDDTWLFREDKRGVERTDPDWRTHAGQPRFVIKDDLTVRQFYAIPAPTVSGDSVGVNTPFTAFVRNNLTVVYTDNTADVQPYEELAVAVDILAREFARESDHQDTTAAQTWRQFATFLLAMVDHAQDTAQ